jgi:prolyl-tRNA synthetase
MRLSDLLVGVPSPGQRDPLARNGYTHRLSDGLWTLLPLGQRVLQRIAAITREELTRVGAQEVTMPLLHPAALWERSLPTGGTRSEAFGGQLFRLTAAPDERLVLAPTHEEVAALVASACGGTIGRPGLLIFQIQPRFRNQRCDTDTGLIQTREFVMADAYSFDVGARGLDERYAAVGNAIKTAIARCGLSVHSVEADGGAIGGFESEELVAALRSVAQSVAVRCNACDYAASVEIARFMRDFEEAEPREAQEVPETDEAVLPRNLYLTAVPFSAADRVVLAVTRTGQRLNATKLRRALEQARIDCSPLTPATAAALKERGFDYEIISLINTPTSVLVVTDEAVRLGGNFAFPSPRVGHIFINLNPGRDFRVDLTADIAEPGNEERCARCGATLSMIRGAEIAHLFKLGTQYTSPPMVAVAGDARGHYAMHMGAYGLGLTRLMAALAEERADAEGIAWPPQIAPYKALVVPLSQKEADTRAAAQLYAELETAGREIVLADISDTAEVQLARADRLGLPFSILIEGRSEEMVTLRERRHDGGRRLPKESLAAALDEAVARRA